jgi:hypothetical protein
VMGTVVFEARHREGVLRETSFFQRTRWRHRWRLAIHQSPRHGLRARN